jgi:hypothetical protein
VRLRQLHDGTPVGQPWRGHVGPVWSVAVGALHDGTPVVVSGGWDGTVRLRGLADGTELIDPLRTSVDILSIAVHGLTVILLTRRGFAALTPTLLK